MGCGDSKEKLEDEMIKLKFQRAQIQMERKNQLKKLEEIEGKKLAEPQIPDFVCLDSEKPSKNIKTEVKKVKIKLGSDKKEKKTKKNSPSKKQKAKSVKTKPKTKNKKTESTKPESKKNGK